MAEQQKDTIYIDLDDEITSIIDKVRSSPHKIVALVLPKRAAMLQSIVNMRLLKRTADEAKKHIVLITSEVGILPLAGAAKVHVAKTLQSKPYIPPPPSVADSPLQVSETETGLVEMEAELDSNKPVGELAGLPFEAEDETIEIDNDEPEPSAKSGKKTKNKKNKKLKIPNFNKFRTRLILGVTAFIGLIVLWYMAFFVMPKAKVVVKTDNTNYATNITMTASSAAKELNKESKVVPAVTKEYKKTDAAKATATGEKDLGAKAAGSVTLSLTDCSSDQVTIPAGTGLTSNNLVFVTQAEVILKSVKIGSSCQNNNFPDFSTGKVNVVAQNAGSQYNLSARSYTVGGFSGVSASGTAMSGGTTNIVKVVSQADIDTAKQKILDQNLQTGKTEVTKMLNNDGYLPLPDTLAVPAPVVTATPNVGDQATEVNVSVTATYNMLGAKLDAVKELIDDDSKNHIDITKQKIFEYGLESAAFRDVTKQPGGDVKFALQAQVIAGAQPDAEGIKKAIAGKKKGEAQTIIGNRPGVDEVTISYSPFWVYKTPKNTGKITVTFEQVQNASSSNR